MSTLNILTLVVLIAGACAEIGQHIIGGEDVGSSEVFLTAKLLFEGELVCGAAILTSQRALTTAHCLASRAPELIVVEWKINDLTVQFAVSNIVTHPDYQYNDGHPIHDIAMLSLGDPSVSPFNAEKAQSTFADNPLPEGTMGTVVGWGRLSADGPLAETLQKVDLPILSDEQCAEIHGDNYKPEFQFCAGYNDPEVKKNICVGDFGNVFYVEVVLYGLASWADQPCHEGPTYVPVFTKLPYYGPWMMENIK